MLCGPCSERELSAASVQVLRAGTTRSPHPWDPSGKAGSHEHSKQRDQETNFTSIALPCFSPAPQS